MSNTAKIKKAKGPIRFEAIIPFCAVVAVIWAYFFFFFDTHARHLVESVGTSAVGAEVNVGSLKTSFWDASLEINDIQVTNKEAPSKNAIELGQIRWKMLWDGLLRGKVVIDDASILDIRLGTTRKRPGRVLPPDPPSTDSKFDQLKEEALKTAEKQFSQNVLGDAASLLQGADPAKQLESIGNELKSSARLKELDAELKKKQKEWEERIARLPKSDELKSYETRAKAIKLDGFSNPLEVQKSVQEIDALVREVDGKIKEVQSTTQAVGSDLKTWQKNIDDIKSFVENDIKDLQNRLKIPSLDATSIAKSLFGPMILSRVRQFEGYMNKAREYMPPKKTAEEKAEFKKPKAHERQKGRNYKFGRPQAYPLFWLRHAAISSKESPDGLSGDLKGTLKNLTDDPPMIAQPLTLAFDGRFPASKMEGVKGLITIDHRSDHPKESLSLSVARFPITEQKLIQSDEVTLGFKEAIGSSKLNVELAGGDLKMTIDSKFDHIQHDVSAKAAMVDEILKKVMSDLPAVTLNATVHGSWTDPKFDIDSNLGRELQAGFQKQLQAKINDAKAQLQKAIDDAIGADKARLTSEFSKTQGDTGKILKAKESEVNRLKDDLEKQKNKALNEGKNKLQQEGQKALDDLKKGFGF